MFRSIVAGNRQPFSPLDLLSGERARPACWEQALKSPTGAVLFDELYVVIRRVQRIWMLQFNYAQGWILIFFLIISL